MVWSGPALTVTGVLATSGGRLSGVPTSTPGALLSGAGPSPGRSARTSLRASTGATSTTNKTSGWPAPSSSAERLLSGGAGEASPVSPAAPPAPPVPPNPSEPPAASRPAVGSGASRPAAGPGASSPTSLSARSSCESTGKIDSPSFWLAPVSTEPRPASADPVPSRVTASSPPSGGTGGALVKPLHPATKTTPANHHPAIPDRGNRAILIISGL